MKLERLTIEGFGSYRSECDLDLSGVAVCAVTGDNGAGKSTLFDSVLWALFGQQPGRSADSVVNESGGGARVEVVFSLDGDVHVFRRERVSGRPRAWYSGPGGDCETPSEVTSAAVGLSGCSPDLARMTVFARQGAIGEFSSVAAGHRRKVLTDAILGEMFKEPYQKARSYYDATLAEHAEHRARLSLLREEAALVGSAGSELAEAENAAAVAKAEADRLKAASAGVDLGLLREAQNAAERVLRIQESLLPSAEKQYRDYSDEADARRGDIEEAEVRAEEARGFLERARHAHAAAAAAASGAGERLDALRGSGAGAGGSAVCWVCESVLSAERCAALCSSLEAAVRGARSASAALERASAAARRAEGEFGSLSAAVSVAEDAARRADERADLLDAESRRLEPLAGQVEELTSRMEGAPSDAQTRNAIRTYENAQRRVGVASERLSRARKAAEALPEAEKKHAEASWSLFGAEKLKESLRLDGVPHLVLSERLESVVWSANDALSALSPGMELRFAVESERGKSRIPMAVEASLGGVWRPYATFSGGERMRLDIAIRVGLCRALGVRFRSLVLDEGWGALDPRGSVALAGLLTRLVSSGEMDSVYTVSHIRDAVESFPHRIKVRKTSDGSTARLVTG